jgi:hypothetical protein
MAAVDNTQECSNCKFWFADRPYGEPDEYTINSKFHGQCRIKAPYDRGWPGTWGVNWCGEWKKREKGKSR